MQHAFFTYSLIRNTLHFNWIYWCHRDRLLIFKQIFQYGSLWQRLLIKKSLPMACLGSNTYTRWSNAWVLSDVTTLTLPELHGMMKPLLQSAELFSWFVNNRYLLRLFHCLAHPNLDVTFATGQKWPICHLCISYQSLAGGLRSLQKSEFLKLVILIFQVKKLNN